MLDSKILVQLVLVKLEEDGREIAVPVEELCDPDKCPVKAPEPDPFRGLGSPAVEERRTIASARTTTEVEVRTPGEHKEISQSEEAGN